MNERSGFTFVYAGRLTVSLTLNVFNPSMIQNQLDSGATVIVVSINTLVMNLHRLNYMRLFID